MTSCKSAISLVKELYKEYGEIAGKLGCGAVAAGVGVAAQNPASAVEAYLKCLEAKDKIDDAVRMADEKYHAVIGRTSSLTIGPRDLPLNSWQSGTISSTFERLFCTSAPMDDDSVTIRLEECGGKGKVGVAICAVDASGHHEELCELTWNDSQSEKNDEKQSMKRTFRGVRGRWVVIHLDGKSALNKFKYKLRVDA